MENKTFYITTPIYYPSDKLHIGHTYCTVATAIWTGGEMRSIHFRNMTYGQGASMALPIFGYFMQGVYSDLSLHFPRGEFSRPSSPLSVELDCSRFQEEILNEVEADDDIWW